MNNKTFGESLFQRIRFVNREISKALKSEYDLHDYTVALNVYAKNTAEGLEPSRQWQRDNFGWAFGSSPTLITSEESAADMRAANAAGSRRYDSAGPYRPSPRFDSGGEPLVPSAVESQRYRRNVYGSVLGAFSTY